jgi:hypothetical protein
MTTSFDRHHVGHGKKTPMIGVRRVDPSRRTTDGRRADRRRSSIGLARALRSIAATPHRRVVRRATTMMDRARIVIRR